MVKVSLIGKDGNAFAILSRVAKALRKHGIENDELAKFYKEAMSSDYENLLRVVLAWVVVEEEDKEDS